MHLFALGIFFGHYICHISDRIQGGDIYIYKYIYVYTYEFVRMGIVLRAVAKSRKSRGLKPQWYVYQTPNTFPTETKKTPEILMKCALNPWPNFRGGTYPGFIASTIIAFNRVSMLRESRCINGIYGNCVSCNSNSAQQKHAQTNYILSREYRELSWRNRVSTNYWIYNIYISTWWFLSSFHHLRIDSCKWKKHLFLIVIPNASSFPWKVIAWWRWCLLLRGQAASALWPLTGLRGAPGAGIFIWLYTLTRLMYFQPSGDHRCSKKWETFVIQRSWYFNFFPKTTPFVVTWDWIPIDPIGTSTTKKGRHALANGPFWQAAKRILTAQTSSSRHSILGGLNLFFQNALKMWFDWETRRLSETSPPKSILADATRCKSILSWINKYTRYTNQFQQVSLGQACCEDHLPSWELTCFSLIGNRYYTRARIHAGVWKSLPPA